MSAAVSRWLRFEVLTPANLGSAQGEATLDRPTQKDAWLDLPFLPDSGLKGSLAGRWGDLEEEVGRRNAGREAIFGSPDRGEEFGRPAPFLIGNAELLAFPLSGGEGRWAWVFLALSVARAARRLGGVAPELWAGLLRIETERSRPYLAWGEPFGMATLAGLHQEASATLTQAAPGLLGLLRRLGGGALAEAPTWLLVPSSAARRLWLAAAERRTATALSGRGKTVRAGSLRRVELIPPGCLFLSLVTTLESGEEPDLLRPLQVGSGEGLGWGWIRGSEVEAAVSGPELPLARRSVESLDAGVVLGEAYAAVGRLAGESLALRKAVKVAVQGFGPRAAFSGYGAALAFHAAKAKPALAPREPGAALSVEVRAERWLLAALRGQAPARPPLQGEDRALLAWLGAPETFSPAGLAELERQGMVRWGALRRAVELGLEDEGVAGEDGGDP